MSPLYQTGPDKKGYDKVPTIREEEEKYMKINLEEFTTVPGN